jgi:hypothetical protein
MARKAAEPVVETPAVEEGALTPPTREELVALVAEINSVLNLEPAITIGRKQTDEDIIAKIVEECDGNIYDIDFTADANDATIPFFSEAADIAFEALGIEVQAGSPPAEEPAPAPAKAGKAAKATKADPVAKADKPKVTKAPKEPKEKKYTRDMAVIESIEALCKKGADFKTIMDNSDKIYVKNGGNSVPDAVNVNKYTLNGLIAFDVLVLKDGIYKFK